MKINLGVLQVGISGFITLFFSGCWVAVLFGWEPSSRFVALTAFAAMMFASFQGTLLSLKWNKQYSDTLEVSMKKIDP